MPLPLLLKRASLVPFALLLAPAQPRQAAPPAAPGGEVLQYQVEWRLIHAGNVRLEWKNSGNGFQSRLQLQSAGLVSMLYKVDNLYQSRLDANLCAESALLTVREGPRDRETHVTYDSLRLKATRVERDLRRNAVLNSTEVAIPACVGDVVAGLYQLRGMRLGAGRAVEIPISDGKKSVMARVEAQQRETVDTPAGKYQAVRYEVFLFNDVLYRRSGRLYVWLTDDDRREPVQIRVRLQFAVGTVTLQLEKAEST